MTHKIGPFNYLSTAAWGHVAETLGVQLYNCLKSAKTSVAETKKERFHSSLVAPIRRVFCSHVSLMLCW